ncbi:MAG: DEAD/DEAH box helicase [Pseudomonadota bacterium]
MNERLSTAYSQADIARWFDQHTLRKAAGYERRVSNLRFLPDMLAALVKGSRATPYEVLVRFARQDGLITAMGVCTCPVGANCKHVVAALVAAHSQRDKGTRVNPQVLDWADQVRARLNQQGRTRTAPRGGSRIHYLIFQTPRNSGPRLVLFKGAMRAQGGSRGQPWNNLERALLDPPQFVDDADLALFRPLLGLTRQLPGSYWYDLPLHGPLAAEALGLMAATERFWFVQAEHDNAPPASWRCTPLKAGAARPGSLAWRTDAQGCLSPFLKAEPVAALALPSDPPWYVDADQGEAGPLECGPHQDLMLQLLRLPPLEEADVPVVSNLLEDLAPDLPAPDASQRRPLLEVGGTPRPLLRLNTLRVWGMKSHRGYKGQAYAHTLLDYATPVFRYGVGEAVLEVQPDERSDFHVRGDGEVLRLRRQQEEEMVRLQQLTAAGFMPVPRQTFYGGAPAGIWGLDSEARWESFFQELAPGLRAQGWSIEVPDDFRHYILEPEAWEAELGEEDNGWFSLSMGIVVEGERLPLAPLLADLFRGDSRWLEPAKLKRIKNTELVQLTLPGGRRVRVTAERIKPLATTLIDLFDNVPASGELRVTQLDAPRLEALTDTRHWQFKGADAVRVMAEKLQGSQGIQPVPAPPGFAFALRSYQQEGLAWLQYLRAQGLGGILADDMGLGKTAQTLAHLLTEKQAGRLTRPALVVLPTSLVFNWQREAERCAPALKVLSLHGKARAAAFDRIPEHDVCLTTYPLLWRDEAELLKHEYSSLILDEAQTVKNAQARAAAVVRKLQARHRLCLTGTPLENHLGELWAQFDFLLPGLLGDSKQFARTWRTPIEKQGDPVRRELLARRLAPFILRRKKEDVARELPEKTIIVRSVELEGGQRDLYEAVRSAMDVKVQEEIASKGFNRSQIVILDALLKLRQVCCDPRLLRTVQAAEKVKERAKLDLLMDMLPELVEEGRKVLVFSQFTTMLELIAESLDKAGIGHVSLTGQTIARERVVAEFQAGLVPVFLISLKAGGVGLNLTTADTVIHFDPWWNPAAENQATDRAHRIGQKNRVFVYKLVVAGSIEERIVALQEKKAALAEGVLSEDAQALAKFGEDDIQALLAPLPGK